MGDSMRAFGGRVRRSLTGLSVLLLLGVAACSSLFGDEDEDPPRVFARGDASADALADEAIPAAAPAFRPLSVREYNAAVAVLLRDDSSPGAQGLPKDDFKPFDNLFEYASVSAAKVEAFDVLAEQVTAALLADDARLAALLPCVPASAGDAACFARVIERMGLLFLRRPIDSGERATFTALVSDYAASEGPKSGLEVLFRVLLQHPDFLYRHEQGRLDPKTGYYALDDFELASKLAFTLWGRPPTAELLDAAASGQLADPSAVRALATRMLADPQARAHLDFFHAAWLGYGKLAPGADKAPALAADMRAETRHLVERVVFGPNGEGGPWRALLTMDEAWVTPALATHYGLPAPQDAQGGWVKSTDPQRRGIFGTASFLSVGQKFGDTSTTQRGYNIKKQIFCETIAPPPANLNVDEPPHDATNPSRCKADQLATTLLAPNSVCITCHGKLDPIGFGLERYDGQGALRSTQPGAPECSLAGKGEVAGRGAFEGPAGLAELALSSGRVEYCAVQRWINLANGSKVDPRIEALTNRAYADFKTDGNLRSFILRQVTDPLFRLRRPLE